MSRRNGEKARASIARRNRNAQRVKDRATLAALRHPAAAKPAAKSSAKEAKS